jgi:transglutaminase-like putative cysteine protease
VQTLSVLVALASLLALEAGGRTDWSTLLRRSLGVMAAALPMALALFLLLPRLPPFSPIEGLGGLGARTGLAERLAPGEIAALAGNRAPAARVSFAGDRPPPLGERYWRVLVHQRFDGEGWTLRTDRPGSTGRPDPLESVPVAAPTVPKDPADLAEPAATPPARTPSELWLVEPSGLEALPWAGRGRPLDPDLRLSREGELRRRGSAAQRRLYAIGGNTQGTNPAPSDWRLQPPGPWELALPPGTNPRLEALGASWRRLPDPQARLAAAEAWFRAQPFRYSLQPGRLPAEAPLDAFLFARREGFCGHYASALSALMRAAGVPARVVSGYRGGEWVQPWGGPGYLDLRQDNAHAWSVVWLAGQGWQRRDASDWIAPERREGRPLAVGRGPLGWLVRQWWGLDLAWGRWWLGFDRGAQEALLQRLLGEHRELVGVVVLGALAAGLGGSVAVLSRLARRHPGDRPRRELERCLALLARHALAPTTGDTLAQFLRKVAAQHPSLSAELEELLSRYTHWRHGPGAKPRQKERALAAELRQQRRRLAQQLARLARQGD